MRFMRRFKEPAIAQFGGAVRLLRSRPVASQDPVLTIAAHDSVSPISFSPQSLVYKKQEPLGVMVNNVQEKTHGCYGMFTPCRS